MLIGLRIMLDTTYNFVLFLLSSHWYWS